MRTPSSLTFLILILWFPVGHLHAAPSELLSEIQEADSFPGNRYVDTAWDAETQRSTLVWEHENSDGTVWYFTQIFESDGTPVTGSFPVAWSKHGGRAPSVANLGGQGLFVYACASTSYHGDERLWVAAVSAADPTQQGFVQVPVDEVLQIDIGGDPVEWRRRVCVVWSDRYAVRRQLLTVFGPDEMGTAGEPDVLTEGGLDFHRNPRISQGNGESGRWVTVWNESLAPGSRGLAAVGLDWAGGVGSRYAVGMGAHSPAVDGDGTNFVVAFLDSFGHSVDTIALHLDATLHLSYVLRRQIHYSPSNSLHEPQVAWAGNELTFDGPRRTYAVCWQRATLAPGQLVQWTTVDSKGERVAPVDDLLERVQDIRIAGLPAANRGAVDAQLFALGFADATAGVFHATAIP